MKPFIRKQTFYQWLFATAIQVISAVPHAYADEPLPINFKGEIIASACEVSLKDQDVDLGQVAITSFGSIGSLSTGRTFSIQLSCPENGPEGATITFSGTPASDNTLLALDDVAGAASGVAVRINEVDGQTQVPLNKPSAKRNLISGQNKLNFTAQYQTLVGKSDVRPGTANATAQFSINYP